MTVIDVYSVYVKPLFCKLLTLCALIFAWAENISLELSPHAAAPLYVADSDSASWCMWTDLCHYRNQGPLSKNSKMVRYFLHVGPSPDCSDVLQSPFSKYLWCCLCVWRYAGGSETARLDSSNSCSTLWQRTCLALVKPVAKWFTAGWIGEGGESIPKNEHVDCARSTQLKKIQNKINK